MSFSNYVTEKVEYCLYAWIFLLRRDRYTIQKLEKTPLHIEAVFLAPPVGLEPTTCGLTVRRSTD